MKHTITNHWHTYSFFWLLVVNKQVTSHTAETWFPTCKRASCGMVSSFARTHKSIHKPDKPYYNQVEDQLLLSEGKLIKQIKCKASYPP